MDKKLNKKSYLTLVIIILVLIALNILFAFIKPDEIVNTIGVENSYLIVFLIAILGGLSSFTGTAYFASLATFGAGGTMPWLLGIIGGIGIFISDSIFFWLASHGRKSVPDNWKEKIEKYSKKIEQFPLWKILLGIYAYLSFTPFPNDILMIILAFAGLKYKQIWWVILAGSITVSILVSYFGSLIW